MKQQIIDIANRIRFLREDAGMSVTELCSKMKQKMSEEEYRKCEAGEIDMNVSILDDIAEVFGVELSTIITGKEPKLKVCSVTKKGKGFNQKRLEEYSYEALAYNFSKKNMEPFVVTIEPSNKENVPLDYHPGREFEYVLEGRCLVKVNDKEYILEEGDSVFLDSAYPHGIKALDGKECKLLVVIN